jgi:poly(3-hydroxybutyrate) depolymerase
MAMGEKIAIKKYGCCLFLLGCFFANSAAAQENTVQPRGIYSSDFVIDGIPRSISFYVPFNYGKFENYPVVFFLHAEGETGKSIIKKYNDIIQPLADSFNCIVVYPDAVKGHWNSKLGEHAYTDTINDAGFITIMVDYFIQQYRADPSRIYAAGFYNGGEMAWRLGCNMPGKIAAVAPFITSVNAAAKYCAPSTYFSAEKFMPLSGKKFSGEAIGVAWKFLMGNKKP